MTAPLAPVTDVVRDVPPVRNVLSPSPSSGSPQHPNILETPASPFVPQAPAIAAPPAVVPGTSAPSAVFTAPPAATGTTPGATGPSSAPTGPNVDLFSAPGAPTLFPALSGSGDGGQATSSTSTSTQGSTAPSQPSPLPASSGSSAGSGSGSGVAFSTLFALLLSLAAFGLRHSTRLRLASFAWRQQAFVAVIERPG